MTAAASPTQIQPTGTAQSLLARSMTQLTLTELSPSTLVPILKVFHESQGTLQIGRGAKGNQAASKHDSPVFRSVTDATRVMSKMHATLSWKFVSSDSNACKEPFIADSNSTNGTFIQRLKETLVRKIQPSVETILHDGDTLTFGRRISGDHCDPICFRVSIDRLASPKAPSPQHQKSTYGITTPQLLHSDESQDEDSEDDDEVIVVDTADSPSTQPLSNCLFRPISIRPAFTDLMSTQTQLGPASSDDEQFSELEEDLREIMIEAMLAEADPDEEDYLTAPVASFLTRKSNDRSSATSAIVIELDKDEEDPIVDVDDVSEDSDAQLSDDASASESEDDCTQQAEEPSDEHCVDSLSDDDDDRSLNSDEMDSRSHSILHLAEVIDHSRVRSPSTSLHGDEDNRDQDFSDFDEYAEEDCWDEDLEYGEDCAKFDESVYGHGRQNVISMCRPPSHIRFSHDKIQHSESPLPSPPQSNTDISEAEVRSVDVAPEADDVEVELAIIEDAFDTKTIAELATLPWHDASEDASPMRFKRARESDNEAPEYGACFSFLNSRTERDVSSGVVQPLQDAITSTVSLFTSTFIEDIPAIEIAPAQKRRRIDTRLVVSSTVAFLSGATMAFVGLCALGDAQ